MRLKRPKIITPALDKGVIKEMFVVTKSRFQVLIFTAAVTLYTSSRKLYYAETTGDSI